MPANPWPRFSIRVVPRDFPEERHVIHKNLHLLSLAGIRDGGRRIPAARMAAVPALADFLEQRGWRGGEWIILNVGGGWPSKILNAGQWLQIAAGLNNDPRLVLLWGNEKERETAEAVARQSGAVLAPFMTFRRPDLFHRPGAAGRFGRYPGRCTWPT